MRAPSSAAVLPRRIALARLAAPAALLIARATPAQTAAIPRARLRIVATFSILADIARQVAGDDGDVTPLVGADADAHVYEPSPRDARRLAEADLVVVNGLGFEGWLDRLVRAAGYRGRVVVASDGIAVRRLGGVADPHAWQDMVNGRRYAENIAAAIAAVLPALADATRRRAATYGEQCAVLDGRIRARFAALPRDRRRVVTTHDSFAYFGAAYGVDFLAAEGMSTDSEPTAAAIARLVDQLRSRQVRAVFVENITDPRLVERLAREGHASVGGKLYSDALSAPGGAADTYLKLVAGNAATIAAALES